MTSSKPWAFSSSMMCSMQGLPTIGTIGFGWLDVEGEARALAAGHDDGLHVRPRCADDVGGAGEERQREADPEERIREVRACRGRQHERERGVQDPGRHFPARS